MAALLHCSLVLHIGSLDGLHQLWVSVYAEFKCAVSLNHAQLVLPNIYCIGSSSIMTLLSEPFQLFNLIQALVLMSVSVYLRNNGIDLLYEEGVSGTWRNLLILASGLIWLNLLGIVCHMMKGFSVFVNATVQVREETSFELK